MRLTYSGAAPRARPIEVSHSVNDDAASSAGPAREGGALLPARRPGGDWRAADDLIELLFFAYRDFVADPDRILARFGFGRAHHRVLHFVDRYPGLTIAELLDILRITKQSLNRVLKDLIEQDYIEQKQGTSDRRQRLLYCTRDGARLAGDLTRHQRQRVARALGASGDTGIAAKGFLLAMIEPGDRHVVERLLARCDPAGA